MTQAETGFPQIERIRSRLKQMATDAELLRLHGFSSRRFALAAPVSEAQLCAVESRERIVIPVALRTFYALLGNGGIGPHFGISAIESCTVQGDQDDNVGHCECLLHPDMSLVEWESLVLQYEENHHALFAGILVFSTLGCSFDVGIVLCGPWVGRVVHIDHERGQIPHFCPYANFLDWYEAWLDEVQAGYDTCLFGLVPTGDEAAVVAACIAANSGLAMSRALQGFAKFRSWRSANSAYLLTLRNRSEPQLRADALEQLARLDFPTADPWLEQGLITSSAEMWAALRALRENRRLLSDKWIGVLQKLVRSTSEVGVLYPTWALLRSLNAENTELLLGFADHESVDVRVWVVRELGRSASVVSRHPRLLQALRDVDRKVQTAALLALRGKITPDLLPLLESMLVACEPDREPEYAVPLIERLGEIGPPAHALLDRVRLQSNVNAVCEAAYAAVYD